MMHAHLYVVWLAGASLALSGAIASAQTAGLSSNVQAGGQGKRVLYRGATLIDGNGGPAQPDMAILVQDDRIKIVAPVRELGAEADGSEVISAQGLYVLPGLIDTHVHLATTPNRIQAQAQALARRHLYSGITALRDMAGDDRSLSELARAARLGEIAAPDIYYAALMAGPTFFKDPRTIASAQAAVPGAVPWMQAVTEDTDLPLAVARARGTSASAIKIYANLPGSLVGNITAEAHRQHMLVWAHAAVFPATPKEVVQAGVDVISHVCMLALQVSERVQSYTDPRPVDYARFAQGDDVEMEALFAEMRRRGTILDATLNLFVSIERRLKDAAQQGSNAPPRALPCTAELAGKLTREAYRNGVRISSGTDYDTSWRDPWPSLFQELEALQDRAGMTPADVIKAATAVAAATFGQDNEMGTVVPGKLANLIFVSRNPLRDVRNLRSVEFTVKRGVLYRRADYRPITAAEMPGGESG